MSETPEWAWREHGDMLALVVRARTGYKIIRKRPHPPPLKQLRAKMLNYSIGYDAKRAKWLGVAALSWESKVIVKRVEENTRFLAYIMLADGIRT